MYYYSYLTHQSQLSQVYHCPVSHGLYHELRFSLTGPDLGIGKEGMAPLNALLNALTAPPNMMACKTPTFRTVP